MFRINFQLKPPANISPWGSMGWFALSLGEYWLTIGDKQFYEYTSAILEVWNGKEQKYVDYQLARFIEDFTTTFTYIAESLPNDFYAMTQDAMIFSGFYQKASDTVDDLIYGDTSDEVVYRAHKIVKWAADRSISAMHLNYGPAIFFFRNGNKLRIVWFAGDKTDEGIPVWTAGNGTLEMAYNEFVIAVEDFKDRIFEAMGQQIALANIMEWPDSYVSKEGRVAEQKEREESFAIRLDMLKSGEIKNTDWNEIRQTMKRLNI
ncbi:DUF5984 family protein [Chitinophagaceae bacterium MMS25-I14]